MIMYIRNIISSVVICASIFCASSVAASDLFYEKKVPNTQWTVYGSMKNGKVNATCKMEQNFSGGQIVMFAKDLADGEIYVRLYDESFNLDSRNADKDFVISIAFIKDNNVIGPYSVNVISGQDNDFIIPNLGEEFAAGWFFGSKFAFKLPNEEIYALPLDGTLKALDYMNECVKIGGRDPNSMRSL